MREHGLDDWSFEIGNHKTSLGVCDYRNKKIVLSQHFLGNPWTQIEDTILHEIAHALAGHEAGHGMLWKITAARIGATPRACASNAVNTAKAPYFLQCPDCKRKWDRFRRSKKMFRSICPYCRISLKAYKRR
jgi:predicted SprT family Zn-dependent metalloprotease